MFTTLQSKIKQLCIQHGDFTLASGKKSTFYLDVRVLTLSPDVWYLAQALHLKLRELEYDAVGGPESGANQIVGAVQCFVHTDSPYKRGFVVRKAEKTHGTAGLIVGTLFKGDRAVILEDVTTSGESVMKAIRAIEQHGAEVVKVISVVDREDGATELFKANDIPFEPLFKVSGLL